MSILFNDVSEIFHLYNENISYMMKIMPNGQIGQLYFGRRIRHKEDFSELFEIARRPMSAKVFDDCVTDDPLSLAHVKQEYASYGTGDFRSPAFEIRQQNGSRISDFVYKGYKIIAGKPELEGLPATYAEDDNEAETLVIILADAVSDGRIELYYTLFAAYGIIARSVRFENQGDAPVYLTKAMSLCIDLPDCNYEWMQFSGAWARERHIRKRMLTEGIQSVGSLRGHSSHEHNPFVILKRPSADEFQGEVMGFSFVYSGNFLAQAEVDTHETTRFLMGIHPDTFEWKLMPGEHFQTPEVVMVYADDGLNGMSQQLHRLYQYRLCRGYWKDHSRPLLINNWEATYFNFTEEKLLRIAKKAQECGIELFVLDDGWFGGRVSDYAGLGDWVPNRDRLPDGISGLAEKIEAMGMKFGLWIEPEMVNKDSDLYRRHPDWVIQTKNRNMSSSRHQHVLDMGRKEVVGALFEMLSELFDRAAVSYVKWDMNRSITEFYSDTLPADRQGEAFHRYILGVYDLYERLIRKFPDILFESCASGGARFDAGMLYYAPQAWASDDTDAVERIKIQYGTSYGYPVSSIGSHVSAVPNHQLHRVTSLKMRADVACFGTFGYELDLEKLTPEELETVKAQVKFMKQYRDILQFGTFYRLQSPFEDNVSAWMTVSADKKTAITGWYRILNRVNAPFSRLYLKGLDPEQKYWLDDTEKYFYGDELMYAGLITSDMFCGEDIGEPDSCGDYVSRIFILKADA